MSLCVTRKFVRRLSLQVDKVAFTGRVSWWYFEFDKQANKSMWEWSQLVLLEKLPRTTIILISAALSLLSRKDWPQSNCLNRIAVPSFRLVDGKLVSVLAIVYDVILPSKTKKLQSSSSDTTTQCCCNLVNCQPYWCLLHLHSCDYPYSFLLF